MSFFSYGASRVAHVGIPATNLCSPLRRPGTTWTSLKRSSSCRLRCTAQQQTKDEANSGTVEGISLKSIAQVNSIPSNYRSILMASLAFVICNMDKVNMSVAIIPMSQQFGWSATTAGVVQSSFFLGYTVSQLPGGWLARKLNGKYVLRAGVFLWSMATVAVPLAARWLPGILASRLMVGLGEGVSPSAATDLVARTIKAEERSRAVSVIFSGLGIGSIAGLLLAPVFIENFGWQSVFYVFGSVGVIWCFFFDPGSSKDELEDHPHSDTGELYPSSKVPWNAFFKTPAVWTMMYVHFCGNWGYFNLLAWLPTYLSDELHLDLTNAALVSILPPLAGLPVSAVASLWADSMIASGVDVTLVRKICQSIAFISPSACMTIVSLNPTLPSWLTVLLLTSGIGLSSFALSGLYCTHQDISRKYASILLGITNTTGAIPGLLGVATTGYLYDQTSSWTLALFAPSIFFYLTGVVVWDLFASSKPQTFDS